MSKDEVKFIQDKYTSNMYTVYVNEESKGHILGDNIFHLMFGSLYTQNIRLVYVNNTGERVCYN